jgi:hypothetical protein
MNQEQQTPSRQRDTGLARWLSGIHLRGLVLVLIGILIGTVLSQVYHSRREQHRLQLARQEAAALFARLTTEADGQLNQAERLLDEWQSDLAPQPPPPANSTAAKLILNRTRQKRVEAQMEQANQLIKRLTGLTEQAARNLAASDRQDLFSLPQQQRLAELGNRWEANREALNRLVLEMDYAREQHYQLALQEAETSRRWLSDTAQRAQAQAESAQRAQTETLQQAKQEADHRAEIETLLRVQAEAAQRTQSDVTQYALFQATQQPRLTLAPVAISSVPYPASYPYSCYQPTYYNYNEPLIIGSSYPDRRLGWRPYLHHYYFRPALRAGPYVCYY